MRMNAPIWAQGTIPPGCGMPPEGVDLLSRMLEYDPNKRITAEQALLHPFFTTVEPRPMRNAFVRSAVRPLLCCTVASLRQAEYHILSLHTHCLTAHLTGQDQGPTVRYPKRVFNGDGNNPQPPANPQPQHQPAAAGAHQQQQPRGIGGGSGQQWSGSGAGAGAGRAAGATGASAAAVAALGRKRKAEPHVPSGFR